jgi:FkbM family methyltransferase
MIKPHLRSAKRYLHEALERVGVYADLRRHLPRGVDWLLDVQRNLDGRAPAVALDVGANVGQTTASIKRLFPMTEVHAFEPVGTTCAQLRAATNHLTGVHCHQLALSDREGELTIPVVPGSVFNSIGGARYENDGQAIPETIRLETLDRFVDEHHIREVDLLKIDTEGHDLAVLSGARSTLGRGSVRCIYVEVTFSPANRQNTLFGPVYDLLQPLGYRFMGLYELDFFQINPWNTSFCNALFVQSARS